MKKWNWLTILTVWILALGTIGIGRAEILPAHGEGQIGLQAVILCETLTVRKEPSVSSQAVKTLHYGDLLIVQPQTGGWAQCFLSDDVDGGPVGWVNEDYLAIDPAWYRTEKQTPVYAWNDTMAPKVALLDENTTLPILKNEGGWLIVSLRGAVGWIAAPAGASGIGRRDGERFETTIMLEGMEETVSYEHAVNAAMGIEFDYDYDMLRRRSEANREYFVSPYDDPEAPLDYLEVKYFAEDAGTIAASICADLSQDFDITIEPWTLDRAGSCVRIDASVIKGTDLMPDMLQTVYIIPAAQGCIVAASHCAIESAEGFGHRIDYMMNTFSLLNGQAE
ncbi:MAG: SH3 domain-containing protein [Clostridia bacterium]|nr:SH3 domain-containing protein [Clostridia bacterium]